MKNYYEALTKPLADFKTRGQGDYILHYLFDRYNTRLGSKRMLSFRGKYASTFNAAWITQYLHGNISLLEFIIGRLLAQDGVTEENLGFKFEEWVDSTNLGWISRLSDGIPKTHLDSCINSVLFDMRLLSASDDKLLDLDVMDRELLYKLPRPDSSYLIHLVVVGNKNNRTHSTNIFEKYNVNDGSEISTTNSKKMVKGNKILNKFVTLLKVKV